nr:PA2778 family cysteine peptidase [Caenimonas aquaedulcis]
MRSAWPDGVARHSVIPNVPFFPQEDYQCGPASLATLLTFSGVNAKPDDLVPQVYLPSRHGSLQLEMFSAPRRWGRVPYALAPRYQDLLREVAAGNPVLVLQDVGPMWTQWHYAVVYGFDYPSGTLYLRSGTKEVQEMPFTAFEREWMKSNYWAMVVTPPDRIPVTATENGWTAATLAIAKTGDDVSALKAYQAALKRWPDNLPAAIGLANQYHARGQFPAAVAVLREAQKRNPQSVIVMNNLAQALSDQGRQEEALAQIDKAAADPHSPFAGDVRSTRAMILGRMGRQTTGSR